jgi:hypothetical protein
MDASDEVAPSRRVDVTVEGPAAASSFDVRVAELRQLFKAVHRYFAERVGVSDAKLFDRLAEVPVRIRYGAGATPGRAP